ncbi:MAG: molybdopterin molybdenumtransferase MoeA [Deltaproteobacteria bacterium]|nr:MAG: molybdopterin molybdenumtransferase MoeA [Deltaproteobacteria bacterium]
MTSLDALVPYEEALARIVAAAEELRDSRTPATRQVGLWDASGYVLAEDVVADRDQPPFARSAMDGYAVRSVDVMGPEVRLRVVGEVAAGQTASAPLGPGEAIAIMTGAPVPEGADAVQMVEKTRRDGEHVIVAGPLKSGHNIAPQGEDARAGAVVVERGRVIESLTAGVLGSVGAGHVTVYQRPRATVMTTGDELVGLEEVPGPGQIRDSNRRTLMALLEREWCRVVDGGIVADDLAETRRAIREGLEGDVLVLSGGVSAGVYDLVRQALEDEGVEILFHKVRIKPGKPLLFGRHPGGLVFGLPGNPVSTFVTGLMLMAPALRILGHRPEHRTWYVRVPLEGTLPATAGRTSFHPAHIVLGDHDRMAVRYCPWHGSADQYSFARANALIRREPGEPAATDGDLVRVAIPHPLASW